MKDIRSELARPQKYKDANGKYYSVIINVSFKQSDNPKESAQKDVGVNGSGYGNTLAFLHSSESGSEQGRVGEVKTDNTTSQSTTK